MDYARSKNTEIEDDILYIVIPAYNEAENIESLISEWYPIIDQHNAKGKSRIVVINDGSTDDTYVKLKELAKTHAHLVVIDKDNGGHGSAILCGYRYAIDNRADWIFQTDADGQTNPDEFREFWLLRDKYDAVIGNRADRKDGLGRKLVEKILLLILWLIFGVVIPDANAPFRLMRRELVEKYIKKMPEQYNLPNVLFTTYFKYFEEKILFVNISFEPRKAGKNSINYRKIIQIGRKSLKDFCSLSENIDNNCNPSDSHHENSGFNISRVAMNRIRAVIVVIAEIYLLIFCVTISPLYDIWGGDSAFYILVGKGMKYGYLPYRDIFDGKGPYLFFLEYIGQIICEGRFGAFIIQSLLFCTSMVFMDKTIGIGRINRHLYDVILLLFPLLMAVFSVAGGGLTEDFSLLPISICMFLFVKFVNGKGKRHAPLFALIYGLSFGTLVFLRINNSAVICAGVLTICIILVFGREWENLLYNAIAFIVGVVFAALPVVVFFAINHTLVEMLNQVFLYGIKYTKLVKESGWISLINGQYKASIIPLCVVLISSLVLFEKDKYKSTLLLWTTTIVSAMAVVASGRNFEHYYALFIPVITLDVWYLWDRMTNTQAERRFASIALTMIFVLSFYGIVKLDCDYTKKNVIVADRDTTVDDSIKDASLHIGEGSVYCWTPNPRWYSVADRFPGFRHCYWHVDQMNTDPDIRVELNNMFLYNPTDWLVLENNDKELPEFVIKSEETYFVETYRNDYWKVFKNNFSQK